MSEAGLNIEQLIRNTLSTFGITVFWENYLSTDRDERM